MTENNTLCAYAHQAETTNFITNNPCCLVTSDPGTGKTRSVLDAHVTVSYTHLTLPTTPYV